MKHHRLPLTAEFDLPSDRVWLNASHQGPLPRRAADAVARMVRWKQQPHNLMTPQPFTEIPENLRSTLARVLSASPDEIALANSSSYGLHLVANGLGLGPGDEVIVAGNDFPSDVLPWLRLQQSGVTVKQLTPQHKVLTAAEIVPEITARTRAVCLTWVHSFSGHMIDVDAIGQLCREVGALFVVNGSQAVGAIPMTPSNHPIDALVSVGFKYLCGPYGTGFCWLGPNALTRLAPAKLYWLSALTADDLAKEQLDLDSVVAPESARQHDIFGTANFFNYAAWAESAALVERTGIADIYAHNLSLAARLIEQIDVKKFEPQHRGDPQRLSSIVFLRPLHRSLDEVATALADAGIDVARRRGMLRLAPHFYNGVDDVDRATEVLNAV